MKLDVITTFKIFKVDVTGYVVEQGLITFHKGNDIVLIIPAHELLYVTVEE